MYAIMTNITTTAFEDQGEFSLKDCLGPYGDGDTYYGIHQKISLMVYASKL